MDGSLFYLHETVRIDLNDIRIAIFIVLGLLSALYFLRALYGRIKWIRKGRPDDRSSGAPGRIAYFIRNVMMHEKIGRFPVFGIAHWMIMWGFVVLLFSSADMVSTGLLGRPVPLLGENIVFLYLRDIFILMVLAGIFLCLLRRLIRKPEWLKNNTKNLSILAYIFVIVVTELAYYAVTAASGANASGIVKSVSPLFSGLSKEASGITAEVLWWMHFLVIFYFLVKLPDSKHLHLLSAGLNTFWHRSGSPGALTPAYMPAGESGPCGAGKLEDFTWKQLFDAFSCVRCGRCNGVCPSYNSGEDLKPKRIFGRLRKLMEPPQKEKEKKEKDTDKKKDKDQKWKKKNVHIAGDILTEEALWNCSACGACVDACPVSCEHLDAIMDVRRYLVSTDESLMPEVRRVFSQIDDSGSPWGLREKASPLPEWHDGLDIAVFDEKPGAEYLYFSGCAPYHDESSAKTAGAFARLMKKAGTDFAIPAERHCCGETARRLGGEKQFKEAAMKNITAWQESGVKKIITSCPHCYNTLKNEYGDLGGNFEVFSHAEFLAGLLEKGKLKPEKNSSTHARITFHDPCYLARFNRIYSEPRKVLAAIPGLKLAEMPHSEKETFCCGAGGGRFWTKEDGENSIIIARMKEAGSTGAEIICTSCPYCRIEFQNELRRGDRSGLKGAIDIAELLAEYCL